MAVSGIARSIRALERVNVIESELKTLVIESIENASLKNVFKKIDIKVSGNVATLNNVEAPIFTKFIKSGKYLEGFKSVGVDIELNRNLKHYLDRSLLQLPEFHLAPIEELVASKFSRFANVKNVDEFKTLLQQDPLLKQQVMKNVAAKTSNGRLVGRTIAISVVGLTAYAAINQIRTELGGCIRYETNKNQLKQCKVVSSSCINKPIGSIAKCDERVLTREQKTETCDATSTLPCQNCDAGKDASKVADNVYYKCYEASFAEALGELVDDFSVGTLKTVEGSLAFIKKLPKVLLFIIPAFIIIFLIFIFYRFIPSKKTEIAYKPLYNEEEY